MPKLGLKVRVHKSDHANNALYRVGDTRAGDDPPANDTENAHAESGKLSVLFLGNEVGEVVLA